MIRLVVTRGFGNGVFNGTIAKVVTRGFGLAAPPDVPSSRTVIVGAINRCVEALESSRTLTIGVGSDRTVIVNG